MNNLNQQSNRNISIDLFRLICAIMVVAIHTQPLYDISYKLGYFATEILPRIAVPYFFAISGYYYIVGLISNKKVFFKNLKKLLYVYTIWSVLYFAIEFVQQVSTHQISIARFVRNMFFDFFIYGSYYQLWYFPAILFCIIIVYISYRFNLLMHLAISTLFLYFMGLLGCAYFSIGTKIPVLNHIITSTTIRRVILMGLPFFMAGYFINLFKSKCANISNQKLAIGFTSVAALYLLEIYLVIHFKLQSNIILTFFLYPLVIILIIILLKNPLLKLGHISTYARGLSNFIFYSHPIFILVISSIGKNIFNFEIENTVKFILTVIASLLTGVLLLKINNKRINSTFL